MERERAEKEARDYEKMQVAQSKINIMDMDQVDDKLRYRQDIVRGGVGGA